MYILCQDGSVVVLWVESGEIQNTKLTAQLTKVTYDKANKYCLKLYSFDRYWSGYLSSLKLCRGPGLPSSDGASGV